MAQLLSLRQQFANSFKLIDKNASIKRASNRRLSLRELMKLAISADSLDFSQGVDEAISSYRPHEQELLHTVAKAKGLSPNATFQLANISRGNKSIVDYLKTTPEYVAHEKSMFDPAPASAPQSGTATPAVRKPPMAAPVPPAQRDTAFAKTQLSGPATQVAPSSTLSPTTQRFQAPAPTPLAPSQGIQRSSRSVMQKKVMMAPVAPMGQLAVGAEKAVAQKAAPALATAAQAVAKPAIGNILSKGVDTLRSRMGTAISGILRR